MRKTQVALAALALVASTAAMADSVTAYGNVDLTVANGDGGTFVGTAGNYQQSRIGFRGTEDLGGGLKADFNLESGIGNTGGISGGGYVQNFFNRAANVGLSNDVVTLRAGTQISTHILAQITGATGVGGDAALVPGLYIVNGGNLANVGNGGLPSNGFFLPNSISASVNAGGLTFTGQTRAMGKGADKYTAIAVSGSFGGINFAVSHQDKTDFWGRATGYDENAVAILSGLNSKQRNTMIAANTQVGAVTINGIWSMNKTTYTGVGEGSVGDLENHKSKGWLIGASMPIAGALSAGITYAKNTNRNVIGDYEIKTAVVTSGSTELTMPSRMISATLKYDLSKTTWLYGTYTSFDSKAAIADNAGVAGVTKDQIAVGMVKAF